nr:MAG TPA: hypothetical protein [Caudoviricetes sp.]
MPREKYMPFYEERDRIAIFKDRHSLFRFAKSTERRPINHA